MEIIAELPDGTPAPLLLAIGFGHELIDAFAAAGLVAMHRDLVKAGGRGGARQDH
jgi:hypothetical protein